MKNILILVIGFVLFGNSANAQNHKDTANLQKYWSYRDRFKKLFIRIGQGTGYSIPIAFRNLDYP